MERKKWTEKELKILEECYKDQEKLNEIEKKFPDRNKKQISSKARSLGLNTLYGKYKTREKAWTDEEIEILTECYKNEEKIETIATKIPNHTEHGITRKADSLDLNKLTVKKNNPRYTAEYQDYDWLYNKFVICGKTAKVISEETGYKKRTLLKWLQNYGLTANTYKYLVRISELQKQIIIAGCLGDGHISVKTDNDDFGYYIETHSEQDKEYLFWKYNILKNLCSSTPTYYQNGVRDFYGKEYLCQPFYRFNTRGIAELYNIKHMTKFEKIDKLTGLGIATHFLDDASRSNDSWEICFGDWSLDEMDYYITNLKNKFGLDFKIVTCDNRYAKCNKENMLKLDKIILENIPNDLDIIKRKITERKK